MCRTRTLSPGVVAWSLMLGVVLTWTLAWASAVLFPLTPDGLHGYEAAGPPHRVISVSRQPGGVSYELKQAITAETLQLVRTQPNRTNAVLSLDYEVPALASRLATFSPAGLSNRTVEVVARGWPWPALRCEVLASQSDFDAVAALGQDEYWGVGALPSNGPWGSNTVYEHSGAFVVPTGVTTGHHLIGAIVLPYAPLWRGLVGNTLFFGVLLMILRTACLGIRRRRRHRRGQCVLCGYDMTGSGEDDACQECGHQRACA